MSEQAETANADLAWNPGHNLWLIALTVTLATFMEVLDTSVANVALPHIAGGLAAGQDESSWVLTSYLVSNAIVLPLSGWLSSIFGRKRFYMSCVVLFTASSFLCGIAPSLPLLIFFRILQGVGGGGLQPSEQAILADTFPPEKRGMAFAIYGMAVVVAPALGPTIGGWITDNYSWRWIFFMNIPVGILSVALTSLLVSDPPWLRAKKTGGIKVDYIGFGLLAIGLGALQIVLDKGEREDWFETHYIVVLTVLSVICSLRDDIVTPSTRPDADGIYRGIGRADDHAGWVRPHADDACGGLSHIQIRCAPDDRIRALGSRTRHAFHGAPI